MKEAQDLYTYNYKTLLKEIKDDQNKKIYICVQGMKDNVVSMANLSTESNNLSQTLFAP